MSRIKKDEVRLYKLFLKNKLRVRKQRSKIKMLMKMLLQAPQLPPSQNEIKVNVEGCKSSRKS